MEACVNPYLKARRQSGDYENQALEALIVGQPDEATLQAMTAGPKFCRWSEVRLEFNRGMAKRTNLQRAAIVAAIKDQE
jgi:hypothetical protein